VTAKRLHETYPVGTTYPEVVKVLRVESERGFNDFTAGISENVQAFARIVDISETLTNISTTDFKVARRFSPLSRLVLVACAGSEED
jgi:hypothetical protein